MKKYFILAAIAAVMTACSNSDDLAQSTNESIPLKIGYSLGELSAPNGTTRSNGADIQTTALLNETSPGVANTLGLFIIQEGNNTHTTANSYEHFNLSSASLTNDNPTTGYVKIGTGTTTLNYPSSKTQGIDIYAYAPHASGASVTDITSDKITFTTETDQTDKDKYMASDVLWGCAGDGANVDATVVTSGAYNSLGKTGNNFPITAEKYLAAKAETTAGPVASSAFVADGSGDASVLVPLLHRGSKIIMNIIADGMPVANLQNAEVELYVDYTSGELNVSTGEFAIPSGALTPASATAIKLTTHLGIESPAATPTVESPYPTTGPTTGYTCSAVIVPQTIAVANNSGNDPIIKIHLKGSTNDGTIGSGSPAVAATATYAYKTGSATNPVFLSGKVYTYNINVKASGLTVTSSVADWVEDTWGTTSLPSGGDAVLQ